jgi:hypothetical protein
MSVPHAVITTAAKSSPPKIEIAAAWALIGSALKLALARGLLGGC